MPWTSIASRTCRRCGERGGEFYTRPNTGNAGRVCRACSRKSNDRAPTPTPNDDAPRTVTVTNSCGHSYTYRIRRNGAEQWLKKQPCPKCRHGHTPRPNDDTPNDTPNDTPPEPEPTPTPTPTPEPDAEWVDGVLALLPSDVLFHRVFVDVLMLVRAGLPVWAQGPPGTSKSTMAEQVASTLGLTFHPMQFHPMMTETDLFGYEFQGVEHRTPFRDAYELGGLFLADEIDNGNSALTAALNGAIANGHCTFAGTVVDMHPDFRCIASANTDGLGPEAGFIGREGVDLATRDRFVTVQVAIDELLESAMADAVFGVDTAPTRDRIVAAVTDVLNARSIARQAEDTTPQGIVNRVRVVRQRVASRFDRVVVSPRMTLHVATMVRDGFTVRESIASKLVGLTSDQVESVVAE